MCLFDMEPVLFQPKQVFGQGVQTHDNDCTLNSTDETTAMRDCPTVEPDSDAPEKSDVSKREVDEYQEWWNTKNKEYKNFIQK